MPQLLQTTLSSICVQRCQDHAANNGLLRACYGERVGLLFHSLIQTPGPRWRILMVLFNNGDSGVSGSPPGCSPSQVGVLQLISLATLKDHKQAWAVSTSCTLLTSTCKAQTLIIKSGQTLHSQGIVIQEEPIIHPTQEPVNHKAYKAKWLDVLTYHCQPWHLTSLSSLLFLHPASVPDQTGLNCWMPEPL